MEELRVKIEVRSGWVILNIEERGREVFRGYGSYLEDVPVQWLKGIKASYEYGIPLALGMDEEGSEVKIVSDEWTGIVTNRENGVRQVYLEDLTKEKLSRSILEGFEEDFVEVEGFLMRVSEEEKEGRRKEIVGLMNWCKVHVFEQN